MMPITNQLTKTRLFTMSIIMLVVFIWSAVPIAISLRALNDSPMISPNEITNIVHILYSVVIPFILIVIIFSVWHMKQSTKKFWPIVIEEFLFNFFSAVLLFIFIFYLLDVFLIYKLKFSVGLISGAIGCTLCLALSSYREVKLKF